MGIRINLIGQKYNKLTVIEETSKRDSSGCIIWKCLCDCGNITYASSNALRSNHKQSCGCANKDQVKQIGYKNCIDMTNQKFGRLTVIKKSDVRKDRKVCWECECLCGSRIIVTGVGLRKGNIQSCGCLKSLGEEKISKLLTSNNILFEREKIFNDFKPYRYDFYVNNQYVIEYDGKQHFQDYCWGKEVHSVIDSQKRDKLKNDYCFKNNIPILRIPYTHLENLTLEDLQLETSQFLLEKEE